MGAYISAENHRQVWIPPGYAHGFMVLSDTAEFLYKTTDYWFPEHERCLIWNDQTINIKWPEDIKPVLSAKDDKAPSLHNAELFE